MNILFQSKAFPDLILECNEQSHIDYARGVIRNAKVIRTPNSVHYPIGYLLDIIKDAFRVFEVKEVTVDLNDI